MRGSGDLGGAFRRGAREWFDGMVSGSRNMIAIGVATGAAGVIVGTISLTGAHIRWWGSSSSSSRAGT